MNGHFPSLEGTGPTPASGGTDVSGAGGGLGGGAEAWGTSGVAVGGRVAGGGGGVGGAWGTPQRGGASVGKQEPVGLILGAASGSEAETDGATPNTGGKKTKGKKGKGVSLFSNAGVRGGR